MCAKEEALPTWRSDVFAKTKAASREFMRGSGKVLAPPQVRKKTAIAQTSSGSQSAQQISRNDVSLLQYTEQRLLGDTSYTTQYRKHFLVCP